jgi:hypothetical protein
MIKKYFKTDKKSIVLIQFVLEGYEHMANVTTLDAEEALIRVSIAEDFLDDINGVLKFLKTKHRLQELPSAEILQRR